MAYNRHHLIIAVTGESINTSAMADSSAAAADEPVQAQAMDRTLLPIVESLAPLAYKVSANLD